MFVASNYIQIYHMNQIPKDLHFDQTGRQKLILGLSKMASAVKSTLGPGGNTVLIESPNHTHGITVTKDGVTVAKSIDLLDPVENLAVKILLEAADKTATETGDGTTTAIVLAEALVLAGNELITPELNRTEVLRSMVEITGKVVEKLKSQSHEVTEGMITDIATISANNDPLIGGIIAQAYEKVGRAGIVRVERSQTAETYSETTQGLKVNRGFLSPIFVNNQRKDECILEDVMILVADMEIANILQLENVLKPIISEGKKLLIISPCSINVINTLAANVIKGNLKVCAVAPPNFGYKQHELMQDIAISVGATYYSDKTGDDLSHINYADLGHAAKVIVGRDSTVILKSDVRAKQDQIDIRVAQLREAHVEATSKADKDFILERIASLTGGVGVIYVGGNTDLEQKELHDRVEDAVCAVRSALEEGILPGAGKALYDIVFDKMDGTFPMPSIEPNIDPAQRFNRELSAASSIMRRALRAPLEQILKNVGLDPTILYKGVNRPGFGYNLKTGKMGDLVEMGVIDPLKVTRSALENAVSVAVTILSTNAIITLARA